jgi:hypothetical protein
VSKKKSSKSSKTPRGVKPAVANTLPSLYEPPKPSRTTFKLELEGEILTQEEPKGTRPDEAAGKEASPGTGDKRASEAVTTQADSVKRRLRPRKRQKVETSTDGLNRDDDGPGGINSIS